MKMQCSARMHPHMLWVKFNIPGFVFDPVGPLNLLFRIFLVRVFGEFR